MLWDAMGCETQREQPRTEIIVTFFTCSLSLSLSLSGHGLAFIHLSVHPSIHPSIHPSDRARDGANQRVIQRTGIGGRDVMRCDANIASLSGALRFVPLTSTESNE